MDLNLKEFSNPDLFVPSTTNEVFPHIASRSENLNILYGGNKKSFFTKNGLLNVLIFVSLVSLIIIFLG